MDAYNKPLNNRGDATLTARTISATRSRCRNPGHRRQSWGSQPEGQHSLFDLPPMTAHAGMIPLQADDKNIHAAKCDGAVGGEWQVTHATTAPDATGVAPRVPSATIIALIDGHAPHADELKTAEASAATGNVTAKRGRTAYLVTAAPAVTMSWRSERAALSDGTSDVHGLRASCDTILRTLSCAQTSAKPRVASDGSLPHTSAAPPLVSVEQHIVHVRKRADTPDSMVKMEKSPPMEDVDKLTNAIARTCYGDRDPLRKLRALVRGGATLRHIADMSVDDLTEEMRTKVTNRSGGSVTNPRAKARAAKLALRRASLAYPAIALPLPPPLPPSRPHIGSIAPEEVPEAFTGDENAWADLNDQVRGDEKGALKAIKKRTFKRYKEKLASALALARCRGFVVDGSFGIRSLTMKPVVDAILEDLDAMMQKATVAGYTAALLRAARDLLGDDPSHREHICHLEHELVARIPNIELTAKELLELDNLAENRVFAADLQHAPEGMLERGKQPGLRPLDALSRIAAGLAFRLKLSYPSLNGSMLARWDRAENIQSADSKGSLHIRIPDPKEPEGRRWVRLADRDIAILNVWDAARIRAGVTSTLLFPCRESLRDGREAVPMNEARSMKNVLNELEAVMGFRLSLRAFKKIVTHVAVKRNRGQTAAIAQAVGVRHPRNLERRWRPEIDKSAA